MTTDVLQLSELGYYAPIALDVEEARKNFLAWANSLPSPIGETIKEMVKGNKDAPLPGNLLGERDAFWLGELFGVSEGTQQLAALGCIAGYAYVMHQDRVMDEGQQATRNQELARNYLYAKILETFYIVSGDSREFWTRWNCYLDEYTEACAFEIQKAREKSSYTAEDLKMVARRSALVKGCMVAYALAEGRAAFDRYEDGIDQLAIGLQIRDNLADLESDREAGQYTYVMSRLDVGKKPGDLLHESTLHLWEAVRTMNVPTGSALWRYIQHLTDENASINYEIAAGNMRLEDLKRFKLEY